jgi:glycerol-1-phosphate dehydrogenase [NAD(P)+]
MPTADPLELLLAGRYPDPDTGELLGAAARAVVIEPTLAGRELELLDSLALGPRLALIADRITYDVLGRRVEAAIAGKRAVQAIVLDAITVDFATVERITGALAPIDAVVAVGSGTVNDLAKLVALARGVPQVVFATAPSMNGYTSLSASILDRGLKRSVRAVTPVGAFFDLGILAAAPPRLIRAGLGDALCRSTAQADWLLAHRLLDRPYRTAPFALLADDERALVAESAALLAGDTEAMRYLVRTLVLSGFGMTICGGSYPASQGEHLISHYVEMMHGAHALHGEQVAVATVAMAELQERMLARDVAPTVGATRVERPDVIAHFGPVQGELCWQELEKKRIDRVAADAINHRLSQTWPQLRAELGGVTIGLAALRAALEAAGAPVEPGDLGWPPALLPAALVHARELRDRYTFLDLAADLAQ